MFTVSFLVTSCNFKEKKASDQIVLIQSNIENTIKDPSYESEENAETDKKFYKRLILRLIRNQIEITDGEEKYCFSDTVSADYEAMLPNCEFYIVDINGDKKLDIGIKYPTNVLDTYYYNPETDTLKPALDNHMYTEILRNGQVMTASYASMRTAYFYHVVNILGEYISTVTFVENYMGESISSDVTENDNFLYSIVVEMRLPGQEKYPNITSSTTEVTKEQWDRIKKPFDELRDNAPKPFNYEELMDVES